MSELTIEAIESKIKQVDVDVDSLRREGDSSRKIEVLLQYKEFLEEELNNAREKNNS